MAGLQLTGYLFSDIEGSSDRWERDAGTMRTLLARHDAMLQTLIADHGGHVVNHTGDGVFAVFQSGNPLECALAIQRAIQAEDWAGEPLRIRIGIHAGEVPPDATDFSGVLANRAARVMSVASGGQTLLSDVAASAFSRPAGARLENLGLHRLKGVPDPVRIYGLTHPDLHENEFPPLQSLSHDARPLPGAGTPFFGRKAEIEAILELLEGNEPGPITLLGPGGYGKTRLATRLAEIHGARFPFGAHFVSLETATSSDDVVLAIAQALGVGFHGTNSEAGQLLDYLRNKRGLLILDNAETVTAHTAFIQSLTDHCPGIRLIITSRSLLGLPREQVFDLGGLGGTATAAREIRASPAYQLFEYQARIARSDFRLGDQDLPQFAELHSLVRGSPLALELAARVCRVSSIATLVAEVRNNLDVLATDDRALPSRHRGVRAVFEYSWALLGPEERQLLADLSIFVSDFALAAAREVAGASLPLLRALESHSLLKRTTGERLELHPLVRQYARGRLAERPGTLKTLERAHAAYFLGLVPSQVGQVCGEQRGELLERLTQELPGLRAAWDHHVERGTLAEVRERIDPLFHLLRLRGLFQEAISWFTRGLQKDGGPGPVDALLHSLIASCRIQQGDAEGATRSATRALEMGGTDPLAIAYAEHALGNTAHARGDVDGARLHYGRALEAWKELGHEPGAYFTLASMASLALQLGDLQGARDLVAESRRRVARLRFDSGIMATFLIAGDIARQQGRLDEARGCYDRALAMHKGVLDPQMRVLILRRLGTLAARTGEIRLARQRHREAHALACDIGDRRLEAECLVDLGADLLLAGDSGTASGELISALELGRELKLVPVLSRALVQLAVHKLAAGDPVGARLIAASLAGHVTADSAEEFESVLQRLGEGAAPEPVPLTLLADDLIVEHRYGALPG